MKTDQEIKIIIRSIIARKRAHRKALLELKAAEDALNGLRVQFNDGKASVSDMAKVTEAFEAAKVKVSLKAQAVTKAEASLKD